MNEKHLLNNRYLLEELLGSGGMAVVYQAHDLLLERRVAVKILRQKYSVDPDFRESFRQEALAAAKLSHPNIVTVHDFGLDGDNLFIVMEYVQGTDLKNLLKQRGQFSIEETLDLMVQACAGVGYAHRAGLVHCDIKPQNMLITHDWRLKVTDFGIARALASIKPDEKAAVVWGSPHYFSPEQASGLAPSPASDVYSLGIVMYEMLTGVLPFLGSSAAELARLHRETLPTAPRQLNPNVSPELELVLLKILSKEPSVRYRTADQLGRVLTTLRETSSGKPDAVSVFPSGEEKLLANTSAFPESFQPERIPPRSAPSRKRSDPLDIDWVTVGLALLALIAVGGLVPFFLWVYFVFNPPIR